MSFAVTIIFLMQRFFLQCRGGGALLYWITGLAGAGKTTIGRALHMRLLREKSAIVFLDGDALRTIAGDRFGYTLAERRACSVFYARLCKYLTDQGLDVICCVCAMFESVRRWNRENIADYLEVFINTDMEVLRLRNQKGLYSNPALDVYGTTIKPELPLFPDIVLNNDGTISAEEQAEMILRG